MRDRVAPLSPRPPTLRFRGGASFGSPAAGSVLRDLTETGELAAVALPAILSSIALDAVLALAPRSSGNSTATGRSPAVLSHGALGLGKQVGEKVSFPAASTVAVRSASAKEPQLASHAVKFVELLDDRRERAGWVAAAEPVE